MPVIGFLHPASPEKFTHLVAAFRQGLQESGYIEGQNVAIEYRWAEGQYDRLPSLALDLVGRKVAVIAATGGDPSAHAAKTATATIPIVFMTASDPVKVGLVTSLNRPGGNLTGVSILSVAVAAKRLELLREVVPNATVIAFLVNPTNPNVEPQLQELQEASRSLGVQLYVVRASADSDFDTAFTAIIQRRAGGLIVSGDALLTGEGDQLVALAARHAVPTIYQWREFVAAGGLMSYGTDLADVYRQLGIYASRILNGVKPADLPVQQSTKVELVINLKTAKTLGLTFPSTLLGRADAVIE
jgi:putative ABC transport system substrate-binding protein